MRVKRTTLALFSALALVIAGCQQDEIRSYDVPKEPTVERPKERMLAALLPNGGKLWFLKMQGPEAAIAPHKAVFESVLQSVRFSGKADEPITWTMPPGWKREAGNEMRYATLRPETDDNVELAITPLPPSEILANVNRWRRQLSLPAVAEAELPKVTNTVKVGGVNATMVDFTGMVTGKMAPSAGGGRTPPFAGMNQGSVPENDTAPASPKYSAPADWKEDPTPRPARITTFKITEGSQAAEVAVSTFPGDVGGVVRNVDRWRKQVGLGEADEQQMMKEIQNLNVGNDKGYYVDLTGPEQGGQRPRMLAVGLPHAGQTWFFKMTGPAELVGKQKTAFEAFVKSVKFDGGKGANP